MLTVGDKVVYPMHGAGVIEAIKEEEVLGQRQAYYILAIPYGGMKVMIPTQQVDSIGIRQVVDEQELCKVATVLQGQSSETDSNWNRRFNHNLSKIKSGCIFEVAEVVRNLLRQDHIKRLSTGERRLLDTARNILISEVVLASGKDSESVEGWIHELSINGSQEMQA